MMPLKNGLTEAEGQLLGNNKLIATATREEDERLLENLRLNTPVTDNGTTLEKQVAYEVHFTNLYETEYMRTFTRVGNMMNLNNNLSRRLPSNWEQFQIYRDRSQEMRARHVKNTDEMSVIKALLEQKGVYRSRD